MTIEEQYTKIYSQYNKLQWVRDVGIEVKIFSAELNLGGEQLGLCRVELSSFMQIRKY